MAFDGVHIACVVVSTRGAASLVSRTLWSQTMTDPGVTDRGSMSEPGASFEIYPATDVFVSVGQDPDASDASSARLFCPAGVTRNVYCAPRDRVAWVPA